MLGSVRDGGDPKPRALRKSILRRDIPKARKFGERRGLLLASLPAGPFGVVYPRIPMMRVVCACVIGLPLRDALGVLLVWPKERVDTGPHLRWTYERIGYEGSYRGTRGLILTCPL